MQKKRQKRLNLSLFSIFYYLIAFFIYVLAIPLLVFKSKKTKYSQAIPSRYFLNHNSTFKENGIWFHSCSMGETKALKVIIEKLEGILPEDINISVVTNTGFEEAKKYTSNVRYLPYELFLPFWIKKQKILLVMEAELWYMMFLIAKLKKTRTVLMNARISDKSYSSYKKFSWFYKKVFKNIDVIFAQSDEDKKRLEELGAVNVNVIGNIKLALLPKISKVLAKPKEFLITAASTHENEEELILNAYSKELGKLVIVPRHPERFDKVDLLIKQFIQDKGLSYHRYSMKEDFSSDIILVDKMGELINIFAITDAVILGGAFEKIGGHNPIEPASFGCRIISGIHYFNQKALFESVENYTIVKNDELKDIMRNIKKLKKSALLEIGNVEPILNEIKRATNGNR